MSDQKTYWNSNGELQEDYDRLYEQLVPDQGECETVEGELIRSISRLYFEYCNNGNCNAMETRYEIEEYGCDTCTGTGYYDEDEEDECDSCFGSGVVEEEEEQETEITERYQYFIDNIRKHDEFSKMCDDLEELMIGKHKQYSYGEQEMKVYDDLVTGIVKRILKVKSYTARNEHKIELVKG